MVCPLPFYDTFILEYDELSRGDYNERNLLVVEYMLFDLILVMMFFRFYFLFRSLQTNSIYTDPYSRKLCASYGLKAGVRFSFLCKFEVETEKTVLSSFFMTVFVLAYILRIFELPYYRSHHDIINEFDEFYNSIYMILITITTVGYGDITPKTRLGKLTAVFTAIFGAFLISLMVLAVGSLFSLSKKQQKALRHIRMTQSASKAIIESSRYFMLKKKLYIIRDKLNKN
jgi:hypothetical protein